MKLSFHGAAGGVTGSCHLLDTGDKRILVDCGLFQGNDDEERRNFDDFGFDPESIDILLLTHAHLDHCGRIPLLVKRGFKGEIIATAATRDLARLVLLDAAQIHEEDAARAARHLQRHGEKGPQPLYGVYDAARAFDQFGRTAEFDTRMEIGRNLHVRFAEAGHILGSAFLVIDAGDGGDRKRIVFSGDLGPFGRPILRDPAMPPQTDYVVMETTYGDRRHRGLKESVAELYEAITETHRRGGNVIIPTFALERAQEILFHLAQGVRDKVLSPYLPVFLDSPMAISATQIFRNHPDCLKPELGDALRKGHDPLDLPGLKFTRQVADSIALNRIESGAVILAGSGMCTGGRVLHHLKHNLWRPECTVIFVGFAAQGTLARRIIDGEKTVKLFGQVIGVRARTCTINGFSAHAGQDELLRWYSGAGAPKTTFLVHGDARGGMAAMEKLVTGQGGNVRCPVLHETVELR